MKDRGDFAQRKLRGIIHIQREAEFGFQPLCAEGEEFAFFPLEQGGFRRLFRGNRFLPVRKGGKGEDFPASRLLAQAVPPNAGGNAYQESAGILRFVYFMAKFGRNVS